MTTVVAEPWEINVTRHEDKRLAGPRGSWWFTGALPVAGQCPGAGTDGCLTSLALPDLSVCTREGALEYFDNSWALTESLFAGLQTAEAFYRPPAHNLRHPMIFYYGHPATLYVNKLRVSGLLADPVDAYLEDVLETGVDEMSWDDLSKNEMVWPSVSEVHAYRATVYRLVRGVIETMRFAPELGRPVTMDDPAWALFLAFEHDRIHLETSSVLIRELPVRLVSAHPSWPAPAPMRRTGSGGKPAEGSVPRNAMVPIAGGAVRLGKPADFPSFGWDNEYGSREVEVAGFETSRYMVSNGEYHEFVADGGYRRPELWSPEGWNWRAFRNAKWPQFWVPEGPSGLHSYRLRTTFEEIDMPWDWPACVNYHEAKAYCAWRGARDGRAYRLPTEAEHRLTRELPAEPGPADDPVMRGDGAAFRREGVNLNLAWGSESPVDHAPPTGQGVHDAAGNLWTLCEDTFNPLESFAVHPYYEDFSTPCFDGRHHMILGGAFVSTGDEASIWSRFHFRPHFLQQSGIRLIAPAEVTAPAVTGAVRSAAPADARAARERLERALLMHCGSAGETFGREDHPLMAAHAFPQRMAAALLREAERAGARPGRILDVGCAVGGGTFTLARSGVPETVGVDPSPECVEAAGRLALGETVTYGRGGSGEGDGDGAVLEARAPRAAEGCRVSFAVAESHALPAELGRFDAVLLADPLGLPGDPAALLGQFTGSDAFLGSGGLLLIAGPGGEDGFRPLLDGVFDLVTESDELAVVGGRGRRFEVLDTDVSVWRKR
ncbi:5-histidylcysteine sulfoxide synthase [Streptomyces sp. CAU 1734]|uniref:5-histidylcysteine sulfoxide synthase n=1 Tax=Streptomyces sp. CAU 1734 TaxID=3140360 RepID=UPI0032618123